MNIKKMIPSNGLLFVTSILSATIASSYAAGAISPATDAISGWCNKLGKELRSVEVHRCLGHDWKSDSQSKEGRPIPYLYWGKTELLNEQPTTAASTPKETKSSGRRILVLGALHGDEISSVSMVFRWIDFLGRTKKDSFLRENVYLFLPLVNPDGFFSSPRSRTNSSGVDLNRNFSTENWSTKALRFWKEKTTSDPRRYPGAKAASETETQVVEKAIENFRPDLIISVHAPYCLVDHDGPISFPNIKSPLPVRTLGAFPGSLGTYAGIERNIPVVTPELPSAKQLPEVKSIEQLFLFIMRAKY